MREREATAYHEAGHAVAALHLGRVVKTVSIVPDEETFGRVAHYPITGKWLQPDVHIDARTRDYLEDVITIMLAGPVAERKAHGRWNHIGASGDRKVALNTALHLVGSERQLRHVGVAEEHLLRARGSRRSAR
jgi:ATP-dependent Zn protease